MTAAAIGERIPARNPESGHLPRKQTEKAIRALRELDESLTHGQALRKVKAWHAIEPMPEPERTPEAWARWAARHMTDMPCDVRRQRPVARIDRDYRMRPA